MGGTTPSKTCCSGAIEGLRLVSNGEGPIVRMRDSDEGLPGPAVKTIAGRILRVADSPAEGRWTLNAQKHLDAFKGRLFVARSLDRVRG